MVDLEELSEIGTRGMLIIPVERALPLPLYRYILYIWAVSGGAWWVVVSGIAVVIANKPRKLFSILAVAFVCILTPLAWSPSNPPPYSSPILSSQPPDVSSHISSPNFSSAAMSQIRLLSHPHVISEPSE